MAEVSVIDWHVHPFRAERWLEAWEPAAARALAFGASRWSLVRSTEDPLHFRQIAIWDDRSDFERYWFSEELTKAREQVLNFYNKPVNAVWFTELAGE
jgi:quinol monooxygenase YgiN